MIQQHEQPLSLNKTELSVNPTLQTNGLFRKHNEHENSEKKYHLVGFRLLAAYTSVVTSQILISQTLAKSIFNNAYRKRYSGELFNPRTEDQKVWVNRQVKNLMKTMIRYNSIVFGTKVLLDEYYSQTLRKNEAYYQSNSSLHYKIGALVGLIAYTVNLPIIEFQSIKSMNKLQTNINMPESQPGSYFQTLTNTWKQLLSVQGFRRVVNHFSFVSLAGVVIYRMIYFGGYQKMKSKFDSPINEYVLAPIGCSSLSLIVSPIDQIKYLQMTSHKGKSFHEILIEKGLKLWNLPGQKIYSSIIKQSFSMSFFVAGQKLCKYMIGTKNSAQ